MLVTSKSDSWVVSETQVELQKLAELVPGPVQPGPGQQLSLVRARAAQLQKTLAQLRIRSGITPTPPLGVSPTANKISRQNQGRYRDASSQEIGKIGLSNVCLTDIPSRLCTLESLWFQGGGKKKYDEDEDFDDTEEETDSDFEDPDTIEVPKTLSAAEKKVAPAAAGDGSDDDIEVISSTNNGTKFGSAMGGFRNILPKPGPGETYTAWQSEITYPSQAGRDFLIRNQTRIKVLRLSKRFRGALVPQGWVTPSVAACSAPTPTYLALRPSWRAET